MDWKFRKDFQVMPGISLTYGTGGIQTSLHALDNDGEEVARQAEKLKLQLFKPFDPAHEIKSASLKDLNSPELRVFTSILMQCSKLRAETRTLLEQHSAEKEKTSTTLNKKEKSLFNFLFKRQIIRLKELLQQQTEQVDELEVQLSLSSVTLTISSEDVFADLYKNVLKSFEFLKRSEKKWDFTSSKQTNRIAERTSAAATVTRSEIELSYKSLPIIRTEEKALCFHNANGGDLYLYPGFLVVYESKDEFAIINYLETEIEFTNTRFIESEQVPGDSVIVDHTWSKVNKDGSPDRRFAGNHQIPVVNYGQLRFSSKSGLNEVYCFSNADYASIFHKSMIDYIDCIKNAQALLNAFK